MGASTNRARVPKVSAIAPKTLLAFFTFEALSLCVTQAAHTATVAGMTQRINAVHGGLESANAQYACHRGLIRFFQIGTAIKGMPQMTPTISAPTSTAARINSKSVFAQEIHVLLIIVLFISWLLNIVMMAIA